MVPESTEKGQGTDKHPPGSPPCPACGVVGTDVMAWAPDEEREYIQMWDCENTECRVEGYLPRDSDPYKKPRTVES